MSKARGIIAGAVVQSLRDNGWYIEDADGSYPYHRVAHALAADIDKALGGLERYHRAWQRRSEWPTLEHAAADRLKGVNKLHENNIYSYWRSRSEITVVSE
ncbi:Uncharacterised protein [Mycobacteroides abscessus subsp. abscessus]|uniref:Uncharacterized protein n=1 Tax=Mycobacteroides abscessus subsp. abscessus TaxID=1185650 RepID=A0AB38D0F6_9MYCO|nr:hypothetical protein [Mycobacteroides abscessus]SHX07536.1 Uncharacterised protein [Mycobacteroides abscessus subsp. abscessus]SIA09964.1 Uncharacterised protein [Mycobacteroides abscessus subsp. abscessus]SIB12671.1 Uncharacterised protein [Mycobacteroides abscessus subsp. abscessus]SIB15898.1 Uncharacterised protein [Mycobacteroides abscessus subsp. abscessus]SIB16235.1 Uncharacterised protein [Mycobacteroides abscessus subsp. abscessus]